MSGECNICGELGHGETVCPHISQQLYASTYEHLRLPDEVVGEMRAAADRIEALEASSRNYKAEFDRAVASMDRIFQSRPGKPPPILPGFCRLGEDKIDALIPVAELVAKLPTYADRDGPKAGKPFVPGRDEAFGVFLGTVGRLTGKIWRDAQYIESAGCWVFGVGDGCSTRSAYSTAEAARAAAKGGE